MIFIKEKSMKNLFELSEEEKNSCKNYVVAKQYTTLDELLSENNVEIYRRSQKGNSCN
jgi:hypothetical protein